jgi:hypothetical protein
MRAIFFRREEGSFPWGEYGRHDGKLTDQMRVHPAFLGTGTTSERGTAKFTEVYS